jgi:hypothetical protein
MFDVFDYSADVLMILAAAAIMIQMALIVLG